MKLFLGYLDDEPVTSSELFLTGRICRIVFRVHAKRVSGARYWFRANLDGIGRRR
jgi:hypothetical protein